MQRLVRFGIRVCNPFYSLPNRVLTAQGLASTPLYRVSANYPTGNYGGLLYFTVKATAEVPVTIFDKLKLASRGRSVNFVQDRVEIIQLTKAFVVLEEASKSTWHSCDVEKYTNFYFLGPCSSRKKHLEIATQDQDGYMSLWDLRTS
jgi:hypothetical protein